MSFVEEDAKVLAAGKELNVDGASLGEVDDRSLFDRARELDVNAGVATADDKAAEELESLSVKAVFRNNQPHTIKKVPDSVSKSARPRSNEVITTTQGLQRSHE